MPGGHLEDGDEDLRAVAQREAREETGLPVMVGEELLTCHAWGQHSPEEPFHLASFTVFKAEIDGGGQILPGSEAPTMQPIWVGRDELQPEQFLPNVYKTIILAGIWPAAETK